MVIKSAYSVTKVIIFFLLMEPVNARPTIQSVTINVLIFVVMVSVWILHVMTVIKSMEMDVLQIVRRKVAMIASMRLQRDGRGVSIIKIFRLI